MIDLNKIEMKYATKKAPGQPDVRVFMVALQLIGEHVVDPLKMSAMRPDLREAMEKDIEYSLKLQMYGAMYGDLIGPLMECRASLMRMPGYPSGDPDLAAAITALDRVAELLNKPHYPETKLRGPNGEEISSDAEGENS